MADFLGDKKDDDQDKPETSELVKVGDKEYSQEELSKIVELGEIGLEAESKFNTKIGNVWPDYSRTKNELKEVTERLEELEQTRVEEPVLDTGLDQEEALKAAKKLGLVTKDDFSEYQKQNYRKFYQEERAAEKLLEESDSLAKKYDGSDGRPKFDTEATLMYMQENGVTKPEVAYKLMYEDKLDEWKERKLGELKKPGMVTNRPGGVKTPPIVRPTSDNLGDLLDEALYG